MTTSKADEQAERRRVLMHDARLREQGSTFFVQTHSDVGGRFAAVGAATVIGTTAVPTYPAASTPFQSDPVGPEPPLGYRIDELEPSAPPSLAQATGEPIERAPSVSSLAEVERRDVGSPLSLGDPTGGVPAQPRQQQRGVGSPPSYRRY